MTTILIVEDEMRLADILAQYLQREGFRIERAGDGRRALELWRAARPALILLDLMLPEIDGIEVARRVRAESEIPIIMLTARDEEVDRLLGLGIGADDYVVKPYSPREVVARVKAVLRRVGGSVSAPSILQVGPLTVDTSAYQVSLEGKILNLTVAEVQVLALLARQPGVVRTRAELLSAVGGLDRGTDERTVDAHIKNLRRKFAEYATMLNTVRGVGYRLQVI